MHSEHTGGVQPLSQLVVKVVEKFSKHTMQVTKNVKSPWKPLVCSL